MQFYDSLRDKTKYVDSFYINNLFGNHLATATILESLHFCSKKCSNKLHFYGSISSKRKQWLQNKVKMWLQPSVSWSNVVFPSFLVKCKISKNKQALCDKISGARLPGCPAAMSRCSDNSEPLKPIRKHSFLCL